MGTNSFTGGSGNIPGGGTDLSRTFLLYSWRLANPTTAQCNEILRGELDSTTTAAFSRGDGSGNTACDSAAIDEISWARVQLPVGTVVVPLTLEMTGAATTITSSAFTAVDPTRTVVFSGGQWASGQSNGETDWTASANTHTSRSKDTLTGGNTTVTLTRASNGGGSKAKWTSYVVQFLP